MLQQTQVSRVLEKYGPFLERFPTVAALAAAPEAEVMATWSGLGYYRRARLLHACAKGVMERFGGVVPRELEELLSLPGIGRYTAGAIASIVHGERAAIVDGNVCRVLQRLEAKRGHAGEKKIAAWAWERAEQLVQMTARGKEVALFNEGLMELGATVCTPGMPKCGVCPLSEVCVARAKGLQGEIPGAKPRAARESVYHSCVVVRAEDGSVLVEQRAGKGLWASMWQAPAVESEEEGALDAEELAGVLGLKMLKARDFERASALKSVFHTTHRAVHFAAWHARVKKKFDAGASRKWVRPEELAAMALANAHRRVLAAE